MFYFDLDLEMTFDQCLQGSLIYAIEDKAQRPYSDDWSQNVFP